MVAAAAGVMGGVRLLLGIKKETGLNQ